MINTSIFINVYQVKVSQGTYLFYIASKQKNVKGKPLYDLHSDVIESHILQNVIYLNIIRFHNKNHKISQIFDTNNDLQ